MSDFLLVRTVWTKSGTVYSRYKHEGFAARLMLIARLCLYRLPFWLRTASVRLSIHAYNEIMLIAVMLITVMLITRVNCTVTPGVFNF